MRVTAIGALDVSAPGVAERVVEIQRAAYREEARLIGFDGIPQLMETAADVVAHTDLRWLGAHADETLAGIVAWTLDDRTLEIDRLAVHPSFARRGLGRRLIEAVPDAPRTVVSTGAANQPARALYEGLGFGPAGDYEVEPGVWMARYER